MDGLPGIFLLRRLAVTDDSGANLLLQSKWNYNRKPITNFEQPQSQDQLPDKIDGDVFSTLFED